MEGEQLGAAVHCNVAETPINRRKFRRKPISRWSVAVASLEDVQLRAKPRRERWRVWSDARRWCMLVWRHTLRSMYRSWSFLIHKHGFNNREVAQSHSIGIFNWRITISGLSRNQGYDLPKQLVWQLNNWIESLFNYWILIQLIRRLKIFNCSRLQLLITYNVINSNSIFENFALVESVDRALQTMRLYW